MAGVPEPRGPEVEQLAKPTWMGVSQGATFVEHARAHRNSAIFGGSELALDADTRALVEALYGPDERRWALEFYVARLDAGVGGQSQTFSDGVTRAFQLYTFGRLRPVRATFSYYVKVLSGDFGIAGRVQAQTFVDGAERDGDILFSADDAWHHVLVHDGTRYPEHSRSSFDSVRFYVQAGASMLFALPALLPGHIHLPTDVGQVPTSDHW